MWRVSLTHYLKKITWVGWGGGVGVWTDGDLKDSSSILSNSYSLPLHPFLFFFFSTHLLLLLYSSSSSLIFYSIFSPLLLFLFFYSHPYYLNNLLCTPIILFSFLLFYSIHFLSIHIFIFYTPSVPTFSMRLLSIPFILFLSSIFCYNILPNI